MKFTALKINPEALYLNKTDIIINEINSFLSDLSINKGIIAKIDCIVPVIDKEGYDTCYNTLKEVCTSLFKDAVPAFSLLPIKSNDGEQCTFQFTLINDSKAELVFKEFQKHHYTVVNIKEETLLFSGAINFNYENDFLRSVQAAHDFGEQLLDYEELHLGHIAVQRNYIENINGAADKATGWDNYKTLNEVQQLYQDPELFKHGFPLQLSYGATFGGCTIDFLACSKAGFPGSQFTSSEAQSQLCYIPALKQAFVGRLSSSSSDSINIQVEDMINQAIDLCTLAKKETSDKCEEIRVYLSNNMNTTEIEKSISNKLNYNKISFYICNLKQSSASVDMEILFNIAV